MNSSVVASASSGPLTTSRLLRMHDQTGALSPQRLVPKRGKVAVFIDLEGNRLDLLGPDPQARAAG